MPSMTSSTSKPKTFRAGWWPPYVSFASKQPWPHPKICKCWRCFDLAGPPFLCWYVLGALCRHSTLKSIGPDRFSSISAQLAYVLHREAPVVLIFSGPWAHIKKTLFSWTWNNVKARGSAQFYMLKTTQICFYFYHGAVHSHMIHYEMCVSLYREITTSHYNCKDMAVWSIGWPGKLFVAKLNWNDSSWFLGSQLNLKQDLTITT